MAIVNFYGEPDETGNYQGILVSEETGHYIKYSVNGGNPRLKVQEVGEGAPETDGYKRVETSGLELIFREMHTTMIRLRNYEKRRVDDQASLERALLSQNGNSGKH